MLMLRQVSIFYSSYLSAKNIPETQTGSSSCTVDTKPHAHFIVVVTGNYFPLH
jgi:hypothetical protein